MFCKQQICDWVTSSGKIAFFAAAISVSVFSSSANGQFSYDTSKYVWLGHHFQQTSTVKVPGASGSPEIDHSEKFEGSCSLITSTTTIYKTDTVTITHNTGPLTNSTLDTANITSLVGEAYLEVDADTDSIRLTMDTTADGLMSAKWGPTYCVPCLSDPPEFELICGNPPLSFFNIDESSAATCPEDLTGGGNCENIDLYPGNCGNVMVPFTVTDYCNGKRSDLRLFHQNTFSYTDADIPQMDTTWIIIKPNGDDPELRTIVRGGACGVEGQYVTPTGTIGQAGYFSNRMTILPGDYILVFKWNQVNLTGSVDANEMTACPTAAVKAPDVQVLALFGLDIFPCPCP